MGVVDPGQRYTRTDAEWNELAERVADDPRDAKSLQAAREQYTPGSTTVHVIEDDPQA